MSLEALRRQGAGGVPFRELAAAAARFLGESPEAVVDEDVREMAVRVAGGTVVHGGFPAVDDPRMRGTRLLAALLLALPGEGVHLLTSTEESAEAEARAARQLYAPLGATVGVLRAEMSSGERRAAYAADVTVGTYVCFGTDRLRDMQALEVAERTGRDAPAAVVHDTGAVLVGNLDTRASLQVEGEPLEAALRAAARHAAGMVEGRDYTAAADYGLPRLTAHGREALYDVFGVVHPTRVAALLLEKRVAEALAAGSATRGEDYDLTDGRIIRRESGRLPGEVPFTGGLRQAIEAKEGVALTAVRWIMAITSVQKHVARYRVVGGTAHGRLLLAGHLAELFGLPVWDRRVPQDAAVESDQAAELDENLRFWREFTRWTAVGDRYRADLLTLCERIQDPAGLASAVEELTGRQVPGVDPDVRYGLQIRLSRVLGYLDAAESYEWSVHWPDGLAEHERAIADLSESLRADLRTALIGRLDEEVGR